jgi:F-type H+-transporting ATPase subunit a
MHLLTEEGGEGFVAPGPLAFEYPPLFTIAGFEVDKPMVQLFFAAALVAGFFLIASRRMQLVPGRFQFAAESVYGGIRNSLGRDILGSHDFARFVPLLVTLFCFIYLNNLFGILPFLQFPTMSRIGYPAALAIIVWVTYLYVGFRRQGFFGYFKNNMFPPGVPAPVYIILAPIELAQVLFIRPLTQALRLFANMFAGHLLLLVFILGGEYMLIEGESVLGKVLSPFAFGMGIALTFFEALVQLLQAYIFTLLTALYIQSSLSEEH